MFTGMQPGDGGRTAVHFEEYKIDRSPESSDPLIDADGSVTGKVKDVMTKFQQSFTEKVPLIRDIHKTSFYGLLET